MSRSYKENFENTNPRRKHVIMSPEEAATGKKTSWSEMEITGKSINNTICGSNLEPATII